MQQQQQSAFALVFVVIIAGMMAVSFGSQARGCATIGQGQAFAATVYGETLTRGDFRAAFNGAAHYGAPPGMAQALRIRELTLDGMIERELLAREAERIGLRATRDEVLSNLVDRNRIYVNTAVDSPLEYFLRFGSIRPEGNAAVDVSGQFLDREGNFSAARIPRYVTNVLRRSEEEFVEWQRRELLAFRMRQVIEAEATVGAEEIRATYNRNTERAKLEYFQFRPAFYRSRVTMTDEAVRTWMAAHESEVNEAYTSQRHRYTGLEPQVHTRHILINAPSSMPEAERTAARQRAEALLARARGGEDFAALARANSEDTTTAPSGGDLGWVRRGQRDQALEEALFALEPNQVATNVVESQFGFHVLRSEGRREGDVPEAEAKRELAEELFVTAQATELARADATRALAYLREGHTPAELDTQLLWGWSVPAAPAEGEAAPTPPTRDPLAAVLAETRSFGRTDAPIPGSFSSAPLTRAAFELTMEQPLPAEPMQLGTDLFVFRLNERIYATDEGFTPEVQEQIRGTLLSTKRLEAVRVHVHRLREAAEREGQIRIDETILRDGERPEEDQEGESSEGSTEERESALPRPSDALPA